MLVDVDIGIRILGAGRAVPPGPPVTNLELLRLDDGLRGRDGPFLERLSARIEEKFGVAERYLVDPPGRPGGGSGQTSEDLAFAALRMAVGPAIRPGPSLLIHGTTTTSRYTGSQAASILGRLGVEAPAYDVKAGCSTSLASLHLAQALLRTGYPDVAVACAETLSKVMHPEIRETWLGLADGGAAVWMERDDDAPDFVIRRSFFSTDGRHVDIYTTPGRLPPTPGAIASHGYSLQGDKDRLAVLAAGHYNAMLDALFSAAFPLSRVTWVVPHQVNRELIDQVLRPRGIGAALAWDAREYGNLGGASVLFSLARCLERRAFQPGDRILLMSVGGGLSSAAQVWEKL